MSLDELRVAKNKSIGTKETLKAVEKGVAKTVFIARDADPHVLKPLIELCAAKNVPLVHADSMESLGRACEIKVGSASAALLTD